MSNIENFDILTSCRGCTDFLYPTLPTFFKFPEDIKNNLKIPFKKKRNINLGGRMLFKISSVNASCDLASPVPDCFAADDFLSFTLLTKVGISYFTSDGRRWLEMLDILKMLQSGLNKGDDE
jgi:hypothetical protein